MSQVREMIFQCANDLRNCAL